jgi:2'-5' RNA ligase
MPRMPAAPGPRLADASLRMFFALWPDPVARDSLASLARDTAAQAQGRAPAAENLHLTLAFLGDVASNRIAILQAIGLAAAAAAQPFALTLDRVGAFRAAGITWAGASSTPPKLEHLVRFLASALAEEGFSTERRAFQPHLTLARRCRRPTNVEIATPIAWAIERITLNASVPESGGPRYRELGSWQLGPPAPVTGSASTC